VGVPLPVDTPLCVSVSMALEMTAPMVTPKGCVHVHGPRSDAVSW
jgi:hypothetical protein